MLYNLTTEQMIELMNNPRFVLMITVVGIWSLIWKGIALWKAGQRKDKPWFIALLVVNTIGLLEIIYIYFIGENCCLWKKRESQNKLQ